MSKPYIDKKINSSIIREFSDDIDPIELMWHRDKHDREVEILEGQNWKFQLDNQLPIELKKGDHIFIPAKEWHRVIKGNTALKIKIKQ